MEPSPGSIGKMHIAGRPRLLRKVLFHPPATWVSNPSKPVSASWGVLVCWDQWYPEAARLMALAGAEILIYPTAIGYERSDDAPERGRQRSAWIISQRGHAVANGLPVVSVNRTGFEPDPSGVTGWHPVLGK